MSYAKQVIRSNGEMAVEVYITTDTNRPEIATIWGKIQKQSDFDIRNKYVTIIENGNITGQLWDCEILK